MKGKYEDRVLTLQEFFFGVDNARDAAENRPLIEHLPHELANWLLKHRRDKNNFWCYGALKYSPFCPLGWH